MRLLVFFLFDDEMKISPQLLVEPDRVCAMSISLIEEVQRFPARVIGEGQCEVSIGAVRQLLSLIQFLPCSVAICDFRNFDSVPQSGALLKVRKFKAAL